MQPLLANRKRFSESIWGVLAALLLAVLWIASMTLVDSKAYTVAPYVCGLLVVVALWAVGVALGCKIVRLRLVSWISLAAGGYFLWRCHTSYSVVEAWQDGALISGCIVFYIAGVYAGQGEGSRWVMGTVIAALLANAASFWFTKDGQALPWSLRPEVGVCGLSTPNTALFTYKNFAAFFVITAGMLPLCRLACKAEIRMGDIALSLLGLAVAGLAFWMGSRSVWLLIPVLACFIWLLRLLVCLAENRRIGIPLIIIGIVFLVGGTILAYEFFFGHALTAELSKTDTHLRTMAWDLACNKAPEGGWLGFGARASQWEIVQRFNEWCTPNMVHNEYLQAWMDYGVIGICCAGGVLLLHFCTGFRQLVSEEIGDGRRAKTAMALLFLLAAAIFAFCDFGWHQAAIAGATAFACGVLASPYPRRPFRWRDLRRNWAPGSRPALVPVRAERLVVRLLALALGCGLAADMVRTAGCTGPAWLASWRYNALVHKHAPSAERVALLEEVHTTYPDSKLIDHYVMQPMPADKGLDTLESMLRRTLEANPRQVFMSIMLADLLGRETRYEEAERILRAAYDGDGSPSCRTNTWAFYYAFNLVRWGQQNMSAGHLETARSQLEYGLAVSRHGGQKPDTAYRTGYKPWEKGRTPQVCKWIFTTAQQDLKFLQRSGVQPDHSWQQPMEKCGKPALYSRWKPSAP